MSRAVLIVGLLALCGGRATGQASDQSCDLPSALAQDDSERSPAIQFSLTDVRDSFGFLQNIAFENQQYSVNDCALSLYAVTIDLPNIPVIGNLPLAGDFMSCFNSTESGDVSQEEVARATIIRFGSQSVPRPAAVPTALYESEGLLVDIRYRQFPTELVQHMRCIYTISRFNLQVWTDVRTTLVGCPETYWGPDCRSECQCQDNGPCHPFTGRCYDDAGPTTPSRLDTTMTPTVIPDTTSAEIETSSPTPVTSTPGPRPPDQCDILPQQQLASVGSSPLRFNFSEIEESVGLWEDVQIDDYFYEVDNCTLILYTRSPGIPRLLVDVQLTEEMVPCYDIGQGSVDTSRVRAQGTFLKYLDQAFPRPAIVPESWYQGNRVVMRIVYDRFPHSDAQSMRCLFNFVALPLNLDVWVDVDTTPMGCPATHYGTSCQSDCPCQNGGRCETFTGECVCPEGTSGESCENGISEVVPTPNPPSTEPPVELAGRDSFADCYPQFADPFIEGDNNGEPEVSFTLSPVQDSLALFEEANVIVEDQLYGVVNCSLTLYLRTSVLPQVLSVPLAGERMTCFRLTNTLMVTSDQVAEGTFLKFLRQALSRPALVPETWYAGLNAVFAITYNSFPVEPLMTMRCNYTVPGVGLNIFIDIVTTTNMVFRQSTRATDPPPVTTTTTTTTPPPVTTTTTTTPPPVTTTTTTTPPPVTTTLPPSTTTPLPPTRGRAAVTTTPVAPPTTTTVPSIPPEIIVTTVRPDPVSGIPGTTPASVDIRPEYRCYIPPHEPLVAAVGQRPINISATPLQDTLGLLSGLQIADYVLDVFNCSLTLYILTTPLPNLPRNLDVVGQPASCLLMQGSAVIPSTELATGTIVKFFDQSLVRPSVVPPSWYESGGLVARVDYNFFPGLYPKTMKCTFNVPSIGNSISTEIETTAIGCPRSHWGPRCENQCPCVNGGSCYTFAGGCHCEELTYGQFCEVMMPLSGPSAVSVRDLNRRNG